jgi:tetratricopeptide (TPR) repeat protein
VTPQLIRVSDDTHLWTDRYTASLAPGEVFAVQAEIAEQVAAALDVTLLGSESAAVRDVTTTDGAAHDAYLLGRFHWNKRTTEDLQRAATYFHEAVDRDSAFAEAYTGLADSYSLFGYYAVPDVSRREAYERAEAAARRAIELDSTLAAAHASLGNILGYGAWDWDAADREFQRAIALDPEYPVAHYWYTEMLMITGRIEEAIEHGERAVALDPASPVARHVLGGALLYAGRLDDALARERESIELVPTFLFGHLGVATVLGLQGEFDEALQAFEAGGLPFAAEFINAWRDPSAARELVAVMGSLEREAPGSPFAEESVAAFTYMIAGAIDSVFARFETAYEQRSEAFLYDMRHPVYDPLRSDPRYLSLMRRVGLEP